jgi:acetyltransferase-like isoleucine patch superfamily enzyme
MRRLIAKILRRMAKLNFELRSQFRRWIIQVKYPNCQIGQDVKIGRNVQFNVTDGGSVIVGNGASIKDNCVIVAKQGPLVIGENSFIGWGAIICANEGIFIGDDCLIAEFVTIRDQNHGSDLDRGPFRNQPMQTDVVEIGDNVWIGAKATVLAGATIANDSVVAAHGVVTSNVDRGVIVGGIPAIVIKTLPRQTA